MKIFSVLFVLGLMDVCFGRSMKKTAIEKRFNEATYAFKFRVTSKETKECFPGRPNPSTPKDTTTRPKTTIASTADTIRATMTRSVSTSTDRFTTVKAAKATTAKAATVATTTSDAHSINTADETSTNGLATVLMETTEVTATPATTMKSSSETATHSHGDSSNQTTASNQMQSSSQPTTASLTTGFSSDQLKTNVPNQKLDFRSSVAHPTKLTSPKLGESNRDGSEVTDDGNLAANTTESLEPARRERSCEMMVFHQDIKIRKIFKGCDGIAKMKRVNRMNKKYLKSTIRLQMGFSELTPNRNYFFMGRAVPGQEPSDYVFMADELTVVDWKPDAVKLKKYYKTKGQC